MLAVGIPVEFHCHIRWPNDPWMGGVTCLRLNNYPETLHNEFLLDNWMKQPFLFSCFRGCWYFMTFGIPRFEWLLHGVCVNFLQYHKKMPTWELQYIGLSKWKSFPNRNLNQNGWNQHLDTKKTYAFLSGLKPRVSRDTVPPRIASQVASNAECNFGPWMLLHSCTVSV